MKGAKSFDKIWSQNSHDPLWRFNALAFCLTNNPRLTQRKRPGGSPLLAPVNLWQSQPWILARTKSIKTQLTPWSYLMIVPHAFRSGVKGDGKVGLSQGRRFLSIQSTDTLVGCRPLPSSSSSSSSRPWACHSDHPSTGKAVPNTGLLLEDYYNRYSPSSLEVWSILCKDWLFITACK